MDLALNNLQGLICHKTQKTSQPTHKQRAQAAGAIEYTNCISAEG